MNGTVVFAQRGALWIALVALALGAPGCLARGAGRGGGGGGGGGAVSASCRGDFGANNAAAKIEAFLAAAADFSDAALTVERDLLGACQRMGRHLGMAEADLAGSGSDGVRTVCAAVSERYRAEVSAIRANVTVESRVQPPHCEVSVDAYASCVAECEARVDPGEIDVQCEGGEIRGQCDAQCTGRCAVDVEASCTGVCEGACEGTCTARAADGSCAGQCDGTCRGRCVVEGQASCSGECRGGCSVEYREPYCTGTVRPPSASARCRASCDARIEAHARCTPGRAELVVSSGLDPAMQARAEAVRAATRDGISAILSLRTRIERLRASGQQIARLAPELPQAAATVSIGAVACASAAAGAVAEAMASASVSVEVSVSVSASFSASASGG